MQDHEHWMHQALEMARLNPQAPFGAIVVHEPSQTVLAAGSNRYHDCPIWHGEMDALSRLKTESPFKECILYTTAEPCPMCQGAVGWVGIPKVVYGTSVPTLKALGWRQFDCRAHEIAARSPVPCELIGGVLEEECDKLFRRD